MTNTRLVGSIQFHGIEPGRSTMSQDYEFEVTISAVVRVRSESKSLAREVVASSALASPSADDIRLANEAEFVRGKRATLVSVDFSVEEDSITSAAARGGLGEGEVEMTDQSDQRPWRLEHLAFESMGDDQRERATIDGVEIVRKDGRYWINSPQCQWSNLDGGLVDPVLAFLFRQQQGGQ
jgi:hypothetical protein